MKSQGLYQKEDLGLLQNKYTVQRDRWVRAIHIQPAGKKREEFINMIPFTPKSKQNLPNQPS